ncbi:hypothetical protein [Paenibacillus lutrae]|uniref:Thioredoxin domain-containing protein n=1 Tax=Paenibacillus lutrae TaxID=2078573 RepID=A0A7X3FF81_9BACL|nr:hypothetical protein [Paenibacillus lutrae]MVO98603.1 hypothetical protein [Paenibacillus lutrae]
MQSLHEEKDHRRFLKQTIENYKLGSYFPEKLILLAKTDPVSFDWLRHTERGTLVFILSGTCSACNTEPVISFMNKYPHFDYCILFEGSLQSLEDHRKELDSNVPIYPCDTVKLHAQLKVNVVPYVIVLNKIGQAVGADIFDNLARLERVASPLIRVYEPIKIRT